MPDPTPAPKSTLEWVIQGIIAISVIVSAIAGLLNHNKIETVNDKVDQKATEVLEKQDDAAVRTAEVKKSLEKSQEEAATALGSQLYGNWRYLQDLATDSGDPKDMEKAAEARRVYEDHIRKHKHKP